jgi:hypothetical protein
MTSGTVFGSWYGVRDIEENECGRNEYRVKNLDD